MLSFFWIVGYYLISRHYKWALEQIFNERNYEVMVILEDDLEVSSDFLTYFATLAPLLISDRTLLCISAWNDNGKTNSIDSTASNLFYR